jgi:hypothetical protein
VRPLTVHYAGAHTGYGPITAGPEGLWYFTLRPRMDFGAKFLPEARGEMVKGPKRHVLGGPVDVNEGAGGQQESSCDAIFPPQGDGIGGWIMRLAPNASMSAPVHAGGLGRFYVIASGNARVGEAGKPLQRWATTFVTPDEEPIRIHADEKGAEVLVLQFPQ